jgi:hypothetical protein
MRTPTKQPLSTSKKTNMTTSMMTMKISTLGSPKELSLVENLRFVIHVVSVDANKKGVVMPRLVAHRYEWTLR